MFPRWTDRQTDSYHRCIYHVIFRCYAGQRSGNIVPAAGVDLRPDHDYDDVYNDVEPAQVDNAAPPRVRRSKLTPPVESTYSIVGEELTVPGPEGDEYSHLRESVMRKNINQERQQGTYSSLFDSSSSVGGDSEHATYSMIIESPKRTVPALRKAPPTGISSPPPLPRPRTAYERVPRADRGSSSSQNSPGLGGVGDSVPRAKFNVVMEQLRKVKVC